MFNLSGIQICQVRNKTNSTDQLAIGTYRGSFFWNRLLDRKLRGSTPGGGGGTSL